MGKIIKIEGKFAVVDFLGEKRKINVSFINASVGDYVICAGDIAADVISKKSYKCPE